ncbi:glycine--tRNA ligase [Candidatus Woesearchaeota archaeon]|nr:MAG: glycine--tRNA ligase [Candidatus Woesearchaeota archaeon]
MIMVLETKSEKIMKVANSRGFFYPSAEIYCAKAGFWTYGHLGTRVKQKWENLWRKTFLSLNPYYFEIDDCVIMPEDVFKASGHLEHFNDPLTECKKCHSRYRADELIEKSLKIEAQGLSEDALTKLIQDNKLLCPKCSAELTEVKMFNMMFKLKVGATGQDVMYLRPESAQSPYLAFKREHEALRRKMPMGLAVIGKAFRNEISPRQGFFRLREFTQAELQIFFDPDKIDECDNWDEVKDYELLLYLHNDKKINKVKCEEANKELKLPRFYLYHAAKIQQFYLDKLRIPKELFRLRELSEEERAFYNKIHFDIELNLESLGGFKEVAGLHYRGDHDIGGHQKGSKQKLEVVDENKRYIPHVLELSFGVDRNVWALMDVFYAEEKERTLFKFPPNVSPIDVAVFPLVKKEELPTIAKKLFTELNYEFKAFYDESGSIGRRYRRQDEIGTNYGITVDFDTMDNNKVTLRDRDSMKQVLVEVDKCKNILRELIKGNLKFEDAGESLK